MKDALKALGSLRKRIEKGYRPILFLDFDGTLAPIRRDPKKAHMSERTRQIVRTCSTLCSVYIVSGRKLSDLRSRTRIPNVTYAGNHGMEWTLGNTVHRAKLSPAARSDVREALRSLAPLSRLRGVIVEDKGISISFHYRAVARMRRDRIERAAQEKLARIAARGRIEVLHQKKLLDVRPRAAHKGDFVRDVLARSGRNAFGIYIGDDATDEDAFTMLTSSMTIRVGRAQKSAAKFSLPSIGSVNRFLFMLSSLLEKSKATSRTRRSPQARAASGARRHTPFARTLRERRARSRN